MIMQTMVFVLFCGVEPELIREIALPDSQYATTEVGGGDYLPVVSADGRTMFFCSTRPGGVGGEDIWASHRDSLGNWSKPENLKDLNTPLNDGPGAISPDGKTMLLGYTTTDNKTVAKYLGIKLGQGSLDIFVSRWKKDHWTEPENLGPPVNSPDWEAHVCFSPDGKAIYFVSTRPGGLGGTDIWVSKWDGKRWSQPENLGEPVNTPGDEYSPFMAADGKTLYFSSDGHPGLGDQDIFFTKLENGKWSQPTNMGKPYNTPGDDRFFSVPASGDYMFFARDNNGNGISHIYRVKLEKDKAPEPVTLVHGRVFDANTGKPLAATVQAQLLETGQVVQQLETDPGTGDFTLILPKRAVYGVIARSKTGDYTYSSFNYDLTQEKTYRESRLEIGLSPVASGVSFSIRNILFDFDSYRIRPESKPELARLADFMKHHPNISVIIQGHTDDRGSQSYNQELSQRRAQAVMQALIEMGVDAKRMKAVGFGETRPLVENTDEEHRQMNRRVEIKIE